MRDRHGLIKSECRDLKKLACKVLFSRSLPKFLDWRYSQS
jgi:hypothetical protein